MTEVEIGHVPPEILEAADSALEEILPQKSKKTYEMAYTSYMTWKTSNNITETNQKVLLAYFKKLSVEYKPPTLWANFSMLKTMLNVREKINIEKFNEVAAFLKQKSRGYTPKKSKVFSATEIDDFLKNAPDEQALDKKVIAIFGIFGALRGDELKQVTVKNVERQGNIYFIKIPFTKTMKARSFVIPEEFCHHIDKYINLRPKVVTTDRFFLNFQRGTCTQQVIGKNKFAAVPQKIAEFLKLPDSKHYTGHSFRRTSATILVDAGASMPTLKRHGGWKSDAVAEGYIDESVRNKKDIGDLLSKMINGQSSSATASTLPSKRVKIQDENLKDNIETLESSANDTLLKKNITFENCNVTINFQ